MKNQVTSLEQSKRLLELGVPAKSASMCWVKDPNEGDYYLAVHDEFCYEVASLDPIPSFTIADLLGVLPKFVDDSNALFIECRSEGYSGSKWCIGYRDRSAMWIDSEAATLLDVCTLGIEWLLSNDYKLEA